MPALDTNILVRHVVGDDPAQRALVRRLIQLAIDDGQTLFVPVTVVLELEWVLRSSYGCSGDEVIRVVAAKGQAVAGTRRWEASRSLVGSTRGVRASRQRRCNSFYSAPVRRLHWTGLLRIFTSLLGMIDGLLGPGAFAKRLRFAPRRRTVGPWLFVAQVGEQWQIVGDLHAPGPSPCASTGAARGGQPIISRNGARQALPLIVDATDPCAVFRPLELVFRADALSASGQLREASDLLLAAITAHELSPEVRGLVDLRRSRLLKRGGRFEEALDLTDEVTRRAGQRGFPDPGQRGLAMQLARRIQYDRAPQDHERLGADPYFGSSSFLPDVRGLGEAPRTWLH